MFCVCDVVGLLAECSSVIGIPGAMRPGRLNVPKRTHVSCQGIGSG